MFIVMVKKVWRHFHRKMTQCVLGNKPSIGHVISIKNNYRTITTVNNMFTFNILLVWTMIVGEKMEVGATWLGNSLKGRKTKNGLSFKLWWPCGVIQKQHIYEKRWWSGLKTHRTWGAHSSSRGRDPVAVSKRSELECWQLSTLRWQSRPQKWVRSLKNVQ